MIMYRSERVGKLILYNIRGREDVIFTRISGEKVTHIGTELEKLSDMKVHPKLSPLVNWTSGITRIIWCHGPHQHNKVNIIKFKYTLHTRIHKHRCHNIHMVVMFVILQFHNAKKQEKMAGLHIHTTTGIAPA